tara:strand:- start:165 stop:656 length:492 start_codon:yes stop_codon:yes gene_type:complete
MTEFLDDSEGELKRAEHMIFVSLKYSRTVDVMRNVIQRLVNSIEFMINGYLDILIDEKKIEELPTAPITKVNQVKKNFKDQSIISMVELYLFLRKLYRAKYTCSREFRRHVTMTSTVINLETDEKTIYEIKIDHLREYFDQTREYWNNYKKLIKGDEESDLYE